MVVFQGGAVAAETEPTSSVGYTITFQSTWSDSTHPYVGFPANAHWSALVGATHNADVTFWEVGQLASAGIEDVAERGFNGMFQGEVNAAITAGDADQWIRQGFAPFAAISSASVEIVVQDDFPLLTLATMIAPSPDWFSGVSSLSLQDGNGDWIDDVVIDVYAYDAGTEEGTEYSADNPATDPVQVISDRTNVSPFSAERVGTLTIDLQEPTAVSLADAQAKSVSQMIWAVQLIVILGLSVVLMKHYHQRTSQ